MESTDIGEHVEHRVTVPSNFDQIHAKQYIDPKNKVLVTILRQRNRSLFQSEDVCCLDLCQLVEVHEVVLQGEFTLHDFIGLTMWYSLEAMGQQITLFYDRVLAVLRVIEASLISRDKKVIKLFDRFQNLFFRLALDWVVLGALDEVNEQFLALRRLVPRLDFQVFIIDANEKVFKIFYETFHLIFNRP